MRKSNVFRYLFIAAAIIAVVLIIDSNKSNVELKECADLSVMQEQQISDQEDLIDEIMIQNHFLDSVIISVDGGSEMLEAFNDQIVSQASAINALYAKIDSLTYIESKSIKSLRPEE